MPTTVMLPIPFYFLGLSKALLCRQLWHRRHRYMQPSSRSVGEYTNRTAAARQWECFVIGVCAGISPRRRAGGIGRPGRDRARVGPAHGAQHHGAGGARQGAAGARLRAGRPPAGERQRGPHRACVGPAPAPLPLHAARPPLPGLAGAPCVCPQCLMSILHDLLSLDCGICPAHSTGPPFALIRRCVSPVSRIDLARRPLFFGLWDLPQRTIPGRRLLR